MKTAKEIHNGNKNRLNLPLHKLIGLAVHFVLSAFCRGLFGSNILAWFFGLWLIKEMAVGAIRFLWGCLIALLSFILIIGIILWIVTF